MSTEKVLLNAKTLRTNQTEAEQRLWHHLRAHRFMALKFKRQKPRGRYIVDFVCVERQLIIEIDGGQHAEQTDYDQRRDAWLRSQGYIYGIAFLEPRSYATVGRCAGADTEHNRPLPQPLSHKWARGVEPRLGSTSPPAP